MHMACKHFNGISWNLEKFVSCTTSVWLLNSFQIFPKIKINFLELEISARSAVLVMK